MIFVCNTGPLIALAKIRQLSLLQDLGPERVVIPPMVQKELWGKIGPETPVIELALNSFIQVMPIEQTDQRIERATSGLDHGEKAVIVLWTLLQGDAVLLMDDLEGRRVVRELGLPILGTAGLLLLAKQRGLIDKVIPLVESIRQQGYWLSDTLVAEVQRLAGEYEA
jgi:predicted nucleic acid-binding protein